MFDRHSGGERAILVHTELDRGTNREDLAEFADLVSSAGIDAVELVTARRQSPQAKFYIGTGKVEELAKARAATEADVVLFNHELSPAQERNLEQELQCRVVDRTGLILDIFAQRAQTFEGKLQVELAQLRHMSTRLVRGWTHLERQKGGIGLRGPGETQLETDRRLLRERIRTIEKRLEKVDRQRDQGRRSRKRANVPTVSLVGYTNAGKSTLFNRLTESQVYAADQLFATLDPTLRRLEVAGNVPVILADTVGFIRHLPHDLVAAFRATLQESIQADLLLHIIDAASERRDDNMSQVVKVLAEIGAGDVPVLEVYNKLDLVPGAAPRIDRDIDGRPIRVWVSAETGAGMALLQEAIAELVEEDMIIKRLQLPPDESRLRGLLYDLKCIQQEQIGDQGNSLLDIRLAISDWRRLKRRVGQDIEKFVVG